MFHKLLLIIAQFSLTNSYERYVLKYMEESFRRSVRIVTVLAHACRTEDTKNL